MQWKCIGKCNVSCTMKRDKWSENVSEIYPICICIKIQPEVMRYRNIFIDNFLKVLTIISSFKVKIFENFLN